MREPIRFALGGRVGSNGAPERQEALGKRATRIDEIVAILKRFDDAGGLLTLEIELVNESNVPPRSRHFISLGGAKDNR